MLIRHQGSNLGLAGISSNTVSRDTSAFLGTCSTTRCLLLWSPEKNK